MRKTTYSIILGMVFSCTLLSGQIAFWPLNQQGSSVNLAGTVSSPGSLSAGNLSRGNGIGEIIYSSGAQARAWSTQNQAGAVDYYEICITPSSGVTLHITSIEYSERRAHNGPRAYELFWSATDFQSSTRIDSVLIPDNTNVRDADYNLDIYTCNQMPLCFRWYGFNAESATGTWTFEENDLKIFGSIVPACTPPTTQPSLLSFSNVTDQSMDLSFASGDGDNRIVIMREGGAVESVPCRSLDYNSDPVFGMGDDIGLEEYVVYNGSGNSVSVSGLTEGATYYVAVFEYNQTDYCYLQTNPLTGDESTICLNPDVVKDVVFTPSGGSVSLNWTAPFCADDVLLIASTSGITGMPTGDGSNYTPNLTYGSGSGGPEFVAPEYPVFKSLGAPVTVTGLTNETTYYFKFFTRLGTDWIEGPEISSVPTTGCPELGANDVVYINEFVHTNAGIDQDEGVEVAGPAGISLNSYELHLYDGGSELLYHVEKLSGEIDDEGLGYGAVWFPIPDMEDGIGGIALYNTTTQTVVQFIGHRGSFTAANGVAMGMTATNVGALSSGTPPGFSVQLIGGPGVCPDDFDWQSSLPYSLGDLNGGQTILPIELLTFDARLIDDQVLISWSTALESNNDYMAVERSLNAREFTEIGRLNGAGNSTQINEYSLWDTKPVPGINYYRLRQVDFDGTTTYHKIVAVSYNSEESTLLVYPTLASTDLTVVFSNELEEDGTIEVYDVTGRKTLQQQLQKGQRQWNIAVNDLASGHYLLRFIVKGQQHTKRFIIQ